MGIEPKCWSFAIVWYSLFFITEMLKKFAATPVKSKRKAPVIVTFALNFIDFEGRFLLLIKFLSASCKFANIDGTAIS